MLLDCSNPQSTFNSISTLFDCSNTCLIDVLQSINLDSIYEAGRGNIGIPSDEYLLEYVKSKLGEPKEINQAIWFHGTRTSKKNKFENGILPLGNALDIVWETLIDTAPSLAVKSNLTNMRQKGVKDRLYQLRTENHEHWGPYGVLVRELAFKTEGTHQHNYLQMPEIMEDIVNSYNRIYGENLYHHYNQALVPVLVKFKSTKSLHSGVLKAAIGYSYLLANELPLNLSAVICIDNKNDAILKKDIIGIEYPCDSLLS